MKKLLIAVVVLAVLAVVVVFGIKRPAVTDQFVMADIIPGDTSFYYSVQNLETIWKNVKDSGFWKEFSSFRLWQDIDIADGIKEIQDGFKENMGIELTESNFLKLAGKELAIAVSAKGAALEPQIIFLARGKDKQSILSVVEPIVKKVNDESPAQISEIQHKGQKITHIKSDSEDQPDIYLSMLGNVLAVGIGDSLSSIQKIMELSDGSSKDSLSANEKYGKIASKAAANKDLAALFYMDFAVMRDYFENLAIPGTDMLPTQSNIETDMIDYIGGWTQIQEGLVTKLYVYPNLQNMTPEIKRMWEIKPQVPATIALTPENSLLYIASNSLDASAMWNTWMENLSALDEPEETETVMDSITGFEENWGISVAKDIMPLLGNEMAFIFSDVSTQGIMPLPKLGLAIKVNDKNKTEALINKLVTKNNEQAAIEAAKLQQTLTPEEGEEGIPEEFDESDFPSIRFEINFAEDSYEGYTIKTIQLPLVGTGLAPGYVFVDDFLLIGVTTKTLQEMIDVKKGKAKSLSQDSSYRGLSGILPEKNNQISFVNMERLMDIGIGVSNWIASFQALTIPQGPPPSDPVELEMYNQQRAQAEMTVAIINDNIIPVLGTLKAAKIIATASENKQDHVEQTLVLRVGDI